MKKSCTVLFCLVLFTAAIVLSGCEETRSGGGGVTDIGRGEPKIVESVTSIEVFENRPDGITDTFSAEFNDQIYLWILWGNIDKTHTIRVSWFSPDDDLDDEPFWTEERSISSTTGEKITWFYIDAPRGGFSGDQFLPGEWFVEIFLNDLFERSHLFFVE